MTSICNEIFPNENSYVGYVKSSAMEQRYIVCGVRCDYCHSGGVQCATLTVNSRRKIE